MTVREVPRRAFVLLAVAVAGCATSAPVTEDFPALRYSYLPLLKLNVATIEIENEWRPGGGPDHVESLAPETPLAALRQMAKDRLGAYGTSGKAVFIIQDASLVRDNGKLIGSFAVRLDVFSADGTQAGFAEARVSQSANAPSGEGEVLREALYTLTSQLMNAMNVEFEYQLRKNLDAWLVQSSATPAAIQAAPLPEPGSAAPPPAPAAPAPGAPAAPQPPTSSTGPKPGVLGTLPISPGQTPSAPTPLMPQTLSP